MNFQDSCYLAYCGCWLLWKWSRLYYYKFYKCYVPGTYKGEQRSITTQPWWVEPTSCSKSGFIGCNQMFLLKVVLFPHQCCDCIQQLVSVPTFAFCYSQVVCPWEATTELWKCTLTRPLYFHKRSESEQPRSLSFVLFCNAGVEPRPPTCQTSNLPLDYTLALRHFLKQYFLFVLFFIQGLL